MSGEDVKIYLFCMFLYKHNKRIVISEISKELGISIENIKKSIENLTTLEVIEVVKKDIVLIDLKSKVIEKLFLPQSKELPIVNKKTMDVNKSRNKIMEAINSEFFHGVMSPTWYYDINMWFEKYQFDEEAMYSLLKYCYNNNSFNKAYIAKVAETWFKNNVKTYSDVEDYQMKYEKVKKICKLINTKLNLKRMLTEYEEEYVEKWVKEYKYEANIIELALKRTTKVSRPSIRYIDAIITTWHDNKLTDANAIELFETENYNKKTKRKATSEVKDNKKNNFSQRKYDDSFLEKLYINKKEEL
jgi:DnaD/phage-associated family protein